MKANRIFLFLIIFALFSCEKINPFDKRRKYVGEYNVTVHQRTWNWGVLCYDVTSETTVDVTRYTKSDNNSAMRFLFKENGLYSDFVKYPLVYKNGDIAGDDGDTHTGSFHGSFSDKNSFSFSVSGYDMGNTFTTVFTGKRKQD